MQQMSAEFGSAPTSMSEYEIGGRKYIVKEVTQAKTDVDEFIRRLKLYFDSPTLTREMCLALFDRLIIGGKETVTGKPQEIHIYYKIDIDSVLSV